MCIFTHFFKKCVFLCIHIFRQKIHIFSKNVYFLHIFSKNVYKYTFLAKNTQYTPPLRFWQKCVSFSPPVASKRKWVCVTVPCSISAQKAYRSQAQFSDVELFLRESPDGGHRLRRERVHGWQPCFSWKTVGTLKWPCYRNHKTWHFRISNSFLKGKYFYRRVLYCRKSLYITLLGSPARHGRWARKS